MSAPTTAPAEPVAARVGGAVVTVAEVDRRLAQVRSAGFVSRLPQPHTAEGRNARRWVVQLLCAEHVVDAELARHGIVHRGTTVRLDVDRALALGGVAAAVWSMRPEITELVAGWNVTVDDAAVHSYFARNRDLYSGSEIAEVKEAIAEELLSAERDRAFAGWLDRAMADSVDLADGFEHPADPRHPDATHHH